PSSLSPHSLPHFLLITPLPPISTLFPYTTLFRSLQAQHDRTPLDDRQHDHAKGRLQRRVLVKVVQHSEDLRLSLQLDQDAHAVADRKSTRLNSSHVAISYAVFCLKKKKINMTCNM